VFQAGREGNGPGRRGQFSKLKSNYVYDGHGPLL
jgi:hypothetical protein